MNLTCCVFLVLFAVDQSLTAITNGTQNVGPNNLLDTRRQNDKKKSRSTSSSSGDKEDSKSSGATSLDMTSSDSSSSTSKEGEKKKRSKPKSSLERRGWRKWHRKCTPCPEDMKKKWRDPSIKWICGAYQRARRSFKSLCMMHYRNCQDGTMFVKIAEHRCANDTTQRLHGEHFFYDYKVVLSEDSSQSSESSETESDSGSW